MVLGVNLRMWNKWSGWYWHDIGMRWNSTMNLRMMSWYGFTEKMKEMDYEELVCDMYV